MNEIIFCRLKETAQRLIKQNDKNQVSNIWDKVFKNGSSKICGRQSLKNLKWQCLSDMVCLSRRYHFTFFKGCLRQILLGPFLNNLPYFMLICSSSQLFQNFPRVFLVTVFLVTVLTFCDKWVFYDITNCFFCLKWASSRCKCKMSWERRKIYVTQHFV